MNCGERREASERWGKGTNFWAGPIRGVRTGSAGDHEQGKHSMKFWAKQEKPGGDWEVWCGGEMWSDDWPTEAEAWAEVLFMLRCHTLGSNTYLDPVLRLETWKWPTLEDNTS